MIANAAAATASPTRDPRGPIPSPLAPQRLSPTAANAVPDPAREYSFRSLRPVAPCLQAPPLPERVRLAESRERHLCAFAYPGLASAAASSRTHQAYRAS